MTDTKMLQIIIDSVASIREDIKSLDRKFSTQFANLNTKIDTVEQKLTARIDNLGLQLANLEDDTPTVEEFSTLQKKVAKLEKRSFSAA